jgi:hypothetical protein
MQLPLGVPLVMMSEIAIMAQVKRPGVAMGRRRHPDFPVPAAEKVGGPQFHGQEMVEWLIATGLVSTWLSHEPVRADLRTCISRLLAKFNYPLEEERAAVDLVIKQMETFAKLALGFGPRRIEEAQQ